MRRSSCLQLSWKPLKAAGMTRIHWLMWPCAIGWRFTSIRGACHAQYIRLVGLGSDGASFDPHLAVLDNELN
jgi:hypothetical protein